MYLCNLSPKFRGRRLGGRTRPGVCLSKDLVSADSLKDETDRRGVGHIKGIRDASTAGKESADASGAVNNDGVGVALGRGSTGLVVVGQDNSLLGNLVVARVVATVGEDVVGAAGLAPLENYNTALVVLVIHRRPAQLLVLDGTLETQEAVARILEIVAVLGVRAHHGGEHVGRELGAKIGDITRKAAWIDLGGVDIDDGHILDVLLSAGPDGSGREKRTWPKIRLSSVAHCDESSSWKAARAFTFASASSHKSWVFLRSLLAFSSSLPCTLWIRFSW